MWGLFRPTAGPMCEVNPSWEILSPSSRGDRCGQRGEREGGSPKVLFVVAPHSLDSVCRDAAQLPTHLKGHIPSSAVGSLDGLSSPSASLVIRAFR